MEVVDDGTGIESPVAFGLRLDGCMEREESRPRARVDDGLVEGAIKIENSLSTRWPDSTIALKPLFRLLSRSAIS